MSEKKVCPKCGEELDEGVEVCPFCGAVIAEVESEDDWMDALSDLEDLENMEEDISPEEGKESLELDDRLDDLLDSILVDTDGSREKEREEITYEDEGDMDNLIDAVVVPPEEIEQTESEGDQEVISAPEEAEVPEIEDFSEMETEPTYEEIPEPADIETEEVEETAEGEETGEGEEIEENAPELDYEATEDEYEEEIEEKEGKKEKKSREKPAKRERHKREKLPRETPSPLVPTAVLAIGLLTFLGALFGFYSSALNNTTAGLIMIFSSFLTWAGVKMRYSVA